MNSVVCSIFKYCFRSQKIHFFVVKKQRKILPNIRHEAMNPIWECMFGHQKGKTPHPLDMLTETWLVEAKRHALRHLPTPNFSYIVHWSHQHWNTKQTMRSSINNVVKFLTTLLPPLWSLLLCNSPFNCPRGLWMFPMLSYHLSNKNMTRTYFCFKWLILVD